MTRGNQREIDRMRAANRHKKDGVGESKGGDVVARREADAKALQEKIAAKRAKEEAISRGEASGDRQRGHGGGAVKASTNPRK